jgi:arginine decarboxylase
MTNTTNFYNIDNWGEGYFSVNASGNIEVSKSVSQKGVELQTIVNSANRAGLKLPLLIRFTDILQDRVTQLYQAFANAKEETQYAAKYTLVYPIKVNQEYCIANALLNTPNHKIGLEAGSKPELMAVIGMLEKQSATIVCNGYKDSSYIRAALIAQQMGHTVFIIIEKRSELDIILREAKQLDIVPSIGVRIRLVTRCAGKWEHTGGSKSKFGLNAEQLLDLVSELAKQNALDCLQLMHCHLGSQIASIDDIRKCMDEVARYFIELRKLNVPINTIDVGGGLAIDYSGTRSNDDCSMNYSLQEYATHIFLSLRDLCEEMQMPVPNVISESGRALTAHHAVLVTNITDVELVKKPSDIPVALPDESRVIYDIINTYEMIAESSPNESYHHAEYALNEAHSMFKYGVISLSEKAKVEQMYTIICLEILQHLDQDNLGDMQLLEAINVSMASKIFCNLSFFQSIPDSWAIKQIFPIAPITQLTEDPSMHSILMDITCDSDGTLKQYAGTSNINPTLLLPPYNKNKPYDIAFFLVGAYQEILGNLHNLFGDTDSLDVALLDDGKFEFKYLVSGDTVTDVLHLAHYDSKKLLQSYSKQLLDTDIPHEKVQEYLTEFKNILSKQTYIHHN